MSQLLHEHAGQHEQPAALTVISVSVVSLMLDLLSKLVVIASSVAGLCTMV